MAVEISLSERLHHVLARGPADRDLHRGQYASSLAATALPIKILITQHLRMDSPLCFNSITVNQQISASL